MGKTSGKAPAQQEPAEAPAQPKIITGYLDGDDPGYKIADDPGYDIEDKGGYEKAREVSKAEAERYKLDEDFNLPL